MQEDAGCSSMTMKETTEPDDAISQSAVDETTDADAAVKQESLAKRIIKQSIGIALAGGLLYWCFKDQNFNELWGYAQQVDPKFILLTALTALLSHFLRAWRWVFLLQPLSDRPISLWNSFCAVMYGYAVNIVVPRGGEVARLVSISKTESIPWAGVLPTMFIDRLLDIAMLVLILGLTISKLPPGILDERAAVPIGILMCVATFAGFLALPFVGKLGQRFLEIEAIKKMIPEGLFTKLSRLLLQFDLGTRSLTRPLNLAIICLFSILIWGCYLANMFLMIWAFHLEKLFDASKTFLVFAIGSVGVLVPTPGCVGSYHALTSLSLQKVAGVNPAQSLAFATVTHLLTFVILACVPAAICFIIQSAQRSKKQN